MDIRRIVTTAAVWAVASASLALAGTLPSAEVEFNVEGRTFTGGQRVDMSGDVDPASQSETIRLETQVYKRGAWRAYDVRRTETTARGRFSYSHPRFPAGSRYRTRALWSETVDHLAGRTVWDPFLVEKKTH